MDTPAWIAYRVNPAHGRFEPPFCNRDHIADETRISLQADCRAGRTQKPTDYRDGSAQEQ
jgi:hypothetical protein